MVSVRHLAASLLVLAACGQDDGITEPEIAQWLRVAGGGDDPAEVVECLSTFMYDELTQAELGEWLSHDPGGMTVEDIQRLPRAIDVADHCRGTAGYG